VPLLYNLYLGNLQRGLVQLDENVYIPPYTSMMVTIVVPPQYHGQEAVQFEPTTQSQLFIAGSIAKPESGKIPINLLNPTTQQ